MELGLQKNANQVLNANKNQMINQFSPNTVFSNKKLQHMNCIFQGDFQIGGLYIGDVISTIKPGILQSGNIKAILGCSYDKGVFSNQARTDIKLDNAIIDCKDSVEYPISMHFGTAYDFIQTHRKNKKNVLVHCHAGVSRSCAIIISYLIKKLGWSAQQAYKFIKSKRQRVKPNLNFWKQLTEYEKQFVPKERWSTLKDSQFEPPRPPLQQNHHNEPRLQQNSKMIGNQRPLLNMPQQINPQNNFNFRQQIFNQRSQQRQYFSPVKKTTQISQNNAFTPQPKLYNVSSMKSLNASPNPNRKSQFYFAPKNNIYNGQQIPSESKKGILNYPSGTYQHKYQQLIKKPSVQLFSQPIYQQKLFKQVISPNIDSRFQSRRQYYKQ